MGRGGKKESVRASALALLVEVRVETSLRLNLTSGTLVHEKSEGSLVTYLFAR